MQEFEYSRIQSNGGESEAHCKRRTKASSANIAMRFPLPSVLLLHRFSTVATIPDSRLTDVHDSTARVRGDGIY